MKPGKENQAGFKVMQPTFKKVYREHCNWGSERGHATGALWEDGTLQSDIDKIQRIQG